MDENENISNPRPNIGATDAAEMKSEGVEIETGDNPWPPEPRVAVPTPPAFTPRSVTQPTPIVTPTPVVTPPPEPKPFIPNTSFVPPTIPSVSPPPAANNNNLKNIRTFRMDAEEAVRDNHTSVINIAVAESKKREQAPVVGRPEKKSKGVLWFSVALIVIALIVIGGAYYFWVVGSQTIQQNQAQTYYPTLMQAQSVETASVDTGDPLGSIGSLISGISTVPIGSIVDIVPVGANGLAIATSTDFFSSIGITVPTQVALSLDGTYMLGTYITNPNHPFIILGVSSFENAYAGMLAWEKTMRQDFASFIRIDHSDEPLVAVVPETFNDMTIDNQDVRELSAASSSPLLFYTFVGTNKVVITTDPTTLSTIITELNTTNTTR